MAVIAVNPGPAVNFMFLCLQLARLPAFGEGQKKGVLALRIGRRGGRRVGQVGLRQVGREQEMGFP